MNTLEYCNVTKEYTNFKLDNLNLSLPAGCIMGFIGENGAGKTTAMKLALGLMKPTQGDIFLFGKNIKDADTKQLKEQIGVVLEEAAYPETMNIKQVEKVLSHIYKTWNNKKFKGLTEQFTLPWDKDIKDFSRGMKMKLSLCAALSHDSRLLILDEATSGLDPVIRDHFLDLFLDYLKEERSIFISSHIISDLEKVCDYISFLHKGKLLFREEKDALLNEYGILKCSHEQLEPYSSHVIGMRKNSFGVEALMRQKDYKGKDRLDKAAIEDIMLYYTKGEKL